MFKTAESITLGIILSTFIHLIYKKQGKKKEIKKYLSQKA